MIDGFFYISLLFSQ